MEFICLAASPLWVQIARLRHTEVTDFFLWVSAPLCEPWIAECRLPISVSFPIFASTINYLLSTIFRVPRPWRHILCNIVAVRHPSDSGELSVRQDSAHPS